VQSVPAVTIAPATVSQAVSIRVALGSELGDISKWIVSSISASSALPRTPFLASIFIRSQSVAVYTLDPTIVARVLPFIRRPKRRTNRPLANDVVRYLYIPQSATMPDKHVSQSAQGITIVGDDPSPPRGIHITRDLFVISRDMSETLGERFFVSPLCREN